MNGFGSGSCNFTNTEGIAGAVCGKVKVVNINPDWGEYMTVVGQSASICSGGVAPKSTSKVEFSVPGVRRPCEHTLGWQYLCGFEFVPQEEDATHTAKLEQARNDAIEERLKRSGLLWEEKGQYLVSNVVSVTDLLKYETGAVIYKMDSGERCKRNRGASEPANCLDKMRAEFYCEWAGARLPFGAEWKELFEADFPWSRPFEQSATAELRCIRRK